MAPTTQDPHHGVAAVPPNGTASPESISTPSNIVALVLLLLFSIALLRPLVTFVYRYCLRRDSGQQTQVDIESEDKYHDVPASDACYTRSSVWASLVSRLARFSSRPSEAELPWPVLAVHPQLRPLPFHRRVLKWCTFSTKSNDKHEPFTVADVVKAIDEINARQQPEVDHAPENVPPMKSQQRNWNRFLSKFKFARSPPPVIPEIVIHPCDTSLASARNENPDPRATSQPPSVKVHYAATTPTTPSIEFSPSPSELDSPVPVTPTTDSLLPTAMFECTEGSASSIITLHRGDAQVPVMINMSNLSRQPFSLEAPPLKVKRRQRQRPASIYMASHHEIDLPDCKIGLGLGDVSSEDLADSIRFISHSRSDGNSSSADDSDLFYDAREEPSHVVILSASSSENSVVDLAAILGLDTSTSTSTSHSTSMTHLHSIQDSGVELGSTSSWLPKHDLDAVTASMSDDSTVLKASPRRYARIIEGLHPSFYRSSLGSHSCGSATNISSSGSDSSDARWWSSCSGILLGSTEDGTENDSDGYDDDGASVASGDTDYYDCFSKSRTDLSQLSVDEADICDAEVPSSGCVVSLGP